MNAFIDFIAKGGAFVLVALALLIGWATGCGETDELSYELSGDCIVLINDGGNKLCAAEAEAWCDTADEFRLALESLGVQSKPQAVCDQVRSK